MPELAEIPTAAPARAPWLQRLSTLDNSQRLRLGLGVALLVALLVAAVVFGRQADYRVLFTNLSDKDGGAIVAQLAQMNVPYKYSEGGGAILVPADRVHDVRLRLATLGLPKGSVVGFEIMEGGNRFGMTQFQERVNFQRGLEGELTRSIQALSSVQSARVHLALPNQNGFFREQQKPSASVLLSLYPGRTLDRAQIAGIVHLVASSVPEMSPADVSVLDDSGKLLSQAPDAAGSGADAQQLAYLQQLEQQYARRIMEILEPVVGPGNVKAQVTAEVDFSQSESTSEQHRPNLAPEASAVRSQQVVESTGPQPPGPPAGVPGATSNQPPGPSNAPINGASAPLAAANGQQQGAAGAASKRESITNYEVDKTVRVTRENPGAVKRLSAAVVVNYQTLEEKGKTVTKALTPEQLEQMTALVRDAIGFNKDRGDSVNLMNAPFQSLAAPPSELPLWKRPEFLDLLRGYAWPIGMVLLAALVLWGLVRPVLQGSKSAAAGRKLDALEAEQPERPPLPAPAARAEALPPPPEQVRLEEARTLAKQNPVAVANILKSWVNGDALPG